MVSWVRLILVAQCFDKILPGIRWLEEKAQKTRKMKKTTNLLYKFLIPIKRSKKSKLDGLFYDTKLPVRFFANVVRSRAIIESKKVLGVFFS